MQRSREDAAAEVARFQELCEALRVEVVKCREAVRLAELRAGSAESMARMHESDKRQGAAAAQMERETHARQMELLRKELDSIRASLYQRKSKSPNELAQELAAAKESHERAVSQLKESHAHVLAQQHAREAALMQALEESEAEKQQLRAAVAAGMEGKQVWAEEAHAIARDYEQTLRDVVGQLDGAHATLAARESELTAVRQQLSELRRLHEWQEAEGLAAAQSIREERALIQQEISHRLLPRPAGELGGVSVLAGSSMF